MKARIALLLQARGARRVASEVGGVASGVEKLGTKSKRAGGQMQVADRKAEKFRKRLHGLGTAAKVGAVAAAGLAVVYGKQAVSKTLELAKASLRLHRNFGLNQRAASELAAVLTARGISFKAATMSFTALSRNVENAKEGSKKAVTAFRKLGISTAWLSAQHGRFQPVLDRVIAGFGRLHGSTIRAPIAQQLLARGYQNLMPLFNRGSKGFKEQIALANKYGVTLGGKPLKSAADMIKLTHEMQFAQLGMQVQMATVVMPAMLKLSRFILGIASAYRHLSPAAKTAIKWISGVAAAIVVATKVNRILHLTTAFRAAFSLTRVLSHKIFQFGRWMLVRMGVIGGAAGRAEAAAQAAAASGPNGIVGRMRGRVGGIRAGFRSLGLIAGRAFAAVAVAEIVNTIVSQLPGALGDEARKQGLRDLGGLLTPQSTDTGAGDVQSKTPLPPKRGRGLPRHPIEGTGKRKHTATKQGLRLPDLVVDAPVHIDGKQVAKVVRRVSLADLLKVSPA